MSDKSAAASVFRAFVSSSLHRWHLSVCAQSPEVPSVQVRPVLVPAAVARSTPLKTKEEGVMILRINLLDIG